MRSGRVIHGSRFLCRLFLGDSDSPLPVRALVLTIWRMDPLLKLLHDNAALKPAQLAKMLNLSEGEVAAKIKAYEDNRVILGYRTVLNEEKLGVELVRAVIEVKITPERGGGFDR